MRPIKFRMARLSDITSKDSKVFCGETLRQVKNLETSILEHGLLNPLIVKQTEQGLIVIDGRKRLMAARRLKLAGTLPRDLHTLPYVLIGEHIGLEETPMALLSNRDQFMEVGRLHTQGHAVRDIADALHVPAKHVRNLLSIAKLSRKLQTEFLSGCLSLKQASAFATLPNKDAQDTLMQVLGPFAEEPDIIRAIYSGETVVKIDDDDAIILPSRAPADFHPIAA